MGISVKNPYYLAAERALKRQGGFYTIEDIIERVKTGEFQSFSNGESWAVTRIAVYPQRTALEVVFILGIGEELQELEKEVEAFAKAHGATAMYAYGRPGYLTRAFKGWSVVSALFLKDISNG